MTFEAKKAIILAAGFGSRMVPVTLDRPKPLVKVNGVRIIDSILDALFDAGIEDITIVRGYKKECFDELLDQYPNLKFIDNDLYDKTNSISSAHAALKLIEGGCYICEADLLIANPDVIRKWHAGTDYLGSFARETDDWCLSEREGYATDYRKGGSECFNCYGISYWTPEDCDQLRRDIELVWNEPGGRNVFYEFVPLVLKKDNYKVRIHECQKGDIVEIDSFQELCAIDPSYKHYTR
ncbi:MAG: phosphocholine cytidylyltransferase family protein [Bacteroidales bacterium]|nr:phosphocholine cytidylyltransferase family protein [Bacteroidales bacterium]